MFLYINFENPGIFVFLRRALLFDSSLVIAFLFLVLECCGPDVLASVALYTAIK